MGQLWDYLVAWSAKKHEVMVSHSVLVANHHHSVVTPKGRGVSLYERDLHGLYARGTNALLKERGFEPIGQIWDNQQPMRMRLMDSAASVSQHVYDRMQNVAAGFVERPSLMPGYDFRREYWRPGCVQVRRMPKIRGFSLSGWAEVEIQYQPEPALVAQFGGDIDALNKHLSELEGLAAGKILVAAGLAPRGAAAARRVHPFDEPTTVAKRRGPAPAFRIGAAGVSCPEKRKRSKHAWREGRAFVSQSWDARVAYRDGDRRVEFPYGTDKNARDINVTTKSECEPDAYWMAPGPSLEDVRRRLEAEGPRSIDEVLRECAAAIETEAGEFKESVDAEYACRKRTPTARSDHNRAPNLRINLDNRPAEDPVEVGEPANKTSKCRPKSQRARSKQGRSQTKPPVTTGRRASDPPE